MLHIATLRGDIQGRFHNALYLGNVPERINVLRESGQFNLAYLTAKSHGMEDEAEAILAELGGIDKLAPNMEEIVVQAQNDGKLLLPPTPILRENNWPLLEVRKGFFDQVEAPDEEKSNVPVDEVQYESSGDESEQQGASLGWGETADIDLDLGDSSGKKKKTSAASKNKEGMTAASEEKVDGGSGWGDDLDIDLPVGEGDDLADAGSSASGNAPGDYFVMPLPGRSAFVRWANSSSLAADQIAAGAFDQAMHLLSRQIGVVNFDPLKEGFLAIHNAAQAYLPLLPLVPALPTPLFRTSEGGQPSELPCLALKFGQVVEPLKSAYKNVTEGKFAAALKEFISIVHTIPLIVVDKRVEIAEVGELLGICREYITALRLELMRKEAEGDAVKQTALAAYFTQCKLQTTHLILGLKSAIKCAYTIKNYQMTATFCRRILEICSSTNSPNILAMVNVKQIKGVLQVCEKSNTDEKPIDFPESNFILCCKTFTPIMKGQQVSKCPYCASTYRAEFEDEVCQNCQLAKIGMQTTGLRVFPE